ncbi:hypothetical protein ACOSP7_030268 [Xanthoceras sorbifolium]
MAICDESGSTSAFVSLKRRHIQAGNTTVSSDTTPLNARKNLAFSSTHTQRDFARFLSTTRTEGKMVHWLVFQVAAKNRHRITPRNASYKPFLSWTTANVTICTSYDISIYFIDDLYSSSDNGEGDTPHRDTNTNHSIHWVPESRRYVQVP